MFSFKDVIGQEAAKERLINEVKEGRIAHALLFCGPSGCGKLALALAYAHYLSCPHRSEQETCGKCPSCIQWNKLIHPDVHFMFPIVKNSKTKRETCDDFLPAWRELLLKSPYIDYSDFLNQMDIENGQPIIYAKESDEINRKLSLKSAEGGYKIVLIWLPEKMNEACANKLLKLLEEPPKMTLFLLVSQEPEKILTTIISRTQRINLPPLSEEEISKALNILYGVEKADCNAIAHMSQGSFTEALKTIHLNEEHALFFDFFVRLMRLAYQRKIREIKLWSEEVASLGRENQKELLAYMQHMIRENFILNFHHPEINFMDRKEENFSSRFAAFVNEQNILGIMNNLSEAQIHIEQNVNPKMVFFDFALNMIVYFKH